MYYKDVQIFFIYLWNSPGTAPDVEVAAGLYPTIITQASGKQVPVVQAYKHTKYLGYLELDFDDSGNLLSWNGQPILLSGDLPQGSRNCIQPSHIIIVYFSWLAISAGA